MPEAVQVAYRYVYLDSLQDFVKAVQLANKLKIQISIRSGSHSWPVWLLRVDAILINLGNLGKLSFVEHNEPTSTVKVSPITTGHMLNEYLGEKGKMIAGGYYPDGVLGGFLLQAGMG
jgi:FAD/FMN-containing dehydrogenase